MTLQIIIAAMLTALTTNAALAAQAAKAAQAALTVEIGWLHRAEDRQPPISPLHHSPDDDAGARLGVADNNTTGKFLGHKYTLGEEARLIIAALPASDLRAAAKAHPDRLYFNIQTEDDELRKNNCLENVFHIIPSRTMKADALAQYLLWKRWDKWLLIRGERPADAAWAFALIGAAEKFGITIGAMRTYAYEATARRTDSGQMQIQKQIPILTQEAGDYDVVVAADESHVFAEYLPYRVHLPRPVAGSAGLRPTAWHPASEQWGATQLQRRFRKQSGRWMNERDYAAWLAARIIGEAAVRIGGADPAQIREYLRSDDFSVAGFKGQALTFRPWNQQLRQPIFIVQPRLVVSVSPQPGFLHQRTPLDSLGWDLPQSECRL